MSLLAHQLALIEHTPLTKVTGRLAGVTGLTVVAVDVHDPAATKRPP